MDQFDLLHGSDHVVRDPAFAFGNQHNDYGCGFYCTKEIDAAREWACKSNTDGFVNRYAFQSEKLRILNLLDGEHSILNWMALLLKNRIFKLDNEIAIDARNYMIEHFSIDVSAYDVVVGYRADDSYFSFANAFVGNGLSLRSLNNALRLGKLGEQTVLVSKRAFKRITFIDAEPVEKSIYYPRFIDRDAEARASYREQIKESRTYRDDIFVLDILREELQNDDPRIQRILLG